MLKGPFTYRTVRYITPFSVISRRNLLPFLRQNFFAQVHTIKGKLILTLQVTATIPVNVVYSRKTYFLVDACPLF